MLYPQNGSIANGSKRSWPTVPNAAAVISEDIVAPRKTPCSQSNASRTSGTTVARRPPNRNASIGTAAWSSHSAAIDGRCAAGPRRHPEEAVLGVDRVEAAVVAELHPRDVVADRLALPALEGRDQHRQVG